MFEVVILIASSSLTANEIGGLFSLVSLEKQQRLKKIHSFQDMCNGLLGDVLARYMICQLIGLNNKQVVFSKNIYGKPFLLNSPQIHFNISHSGHYIACAVANNPVGIDIEQIKPVDLKVAQRFFALDEIEYIMNDEELIRFYEVWTKKESRVKFEGIGLYKSFSSFSVFDFNENEKISYNKVFQNRKTISHVCSFKQAISPSVKVIDISLFMQNITQLETFD